MTPNVFSKLNVRGSHKEVDWGTLACVDCGRHYSCDFINDHLRPDGTHMEPSGSIGPRICNFLLASGNRCTSTRWRIFRRGH